MGEPERGEVIASVTELPLHRALQVRMVDPAQPRSGVEIDVDEMKSNPSGVLHGGVVPMLMDVACYLAVLDELEAGTRAVTVNINVSLLSGVAAGQTVRFTGNVDRRGRSLIFLSAQATHGDRVVATGQVVKSVVRAG